MSSMASHGDTTESLSLNGSFPEKHVSTGYKSFKRKYAKLKIKFELAMKESNTLLKEEFRITDLSKRLKEQNDQLLELLLELNSSIRIPRHLRYDLNVSGEHSPETYSPTQETSRRQDYDPATARQKLREARTQLLEGKISVADCRRLEEDLARYANFAPALQYTELLKTPHTTPTTGSHPSADEDIDSTLGFLSPEHEMQYTSNLDTGLGFTRTGERPMTAERERELVLRNPTSMYNWLRKHDPDVFQEPATTTAPTVAPEKPPPPPKAAATRTSKRAAAQPPKDEKMFDDTYLEPDPEVPKAAGRRRKRDEDTGYRPKGGSSGRSRKKKEDGPTKRKRPAAASAS